MDAVEAHGTGTTLGDPIEAQALLATYGQGRPGGPAAVARVGEVEHRAHPGRRRARPGVMKMVLALRHGVLPRTLHAGRAVAARGLVGGGRAAADRAGAVAGRTGGRGGPGVSAFGISGTNAHVIIEEPPAPDGGPAGRRGQAAQGPRSRRPRHGAAPLPVLGADAGVHGVAGVGADARPGWRRRRAGWREFAAGRRGPGPGGRGVVAGDDAGGVRAPGGGDRARSRAELAGGPGGGGGGAAGGRWSAPGAVAGRAAPGKVVFVFPGQGGQWAGMGAELAAACPVFAARLAECSAALEPYDGLAAGGRAGWTRSRAGLDGWRWCSRRCGR